jgi:hypothetical protein
MFVNQTKRAPETKDQIALTFQYSSRETQTAIATRIRTSDRIARSVFIRHLCGEVVRWKRHS